MVARRKPGRPKGSKNITTVVDVITPACPKCGSHERSKYHNTKTKICFGVTIDGRRYNRVTERTCNCSVCGETRIERWIEFSDK